MVAASIVALLLAGAAASFSRAAYGAAALAVVLIGVMVLSRFALAPRRKVAIMATMGALLLAAGWGLTQTDRFQRIAEIDQVGSRGRLALVPTFARMATAGLPLGTGLGSFDPTYRAFEDYTNLSSRYLNNAHNDLAQLIIETGVPGIIVLFAWASLIATVLGRAWRNPQRLDRDLELGRLKLAVIAFGIIILLGHSLVDYPLRGAAVSATFALLLAQAVGNGSSPRQREA